MKYVIALLFYFSISTSYSSEIPIPPEKPIYKAAEKSAPACKTFKKFFHVFKYVLVEHRNFLKMKFGKTPIDKTIYMFHVAGPCIIGSAYIFTRKHPHYKALNELLFSGLDV